MVKDTIPQANPEEVMETRWVDHEELRVGLQEHPEIYSPWFKAISQDLLLRDDSPWYRLSTIHDHQPIKQVMVYDQPLK